MAVFFLLFNWQPLLCFNAGNSGAVLAILEKNHVNSLLNHNFNFFNHFIAVVSDTYVGSNFFTMVIELFVEGDFKF